MTWTLLSALWIVPTRHDIVRQDSVQGSLRSIPKIQKNHCEQKACHKLTEIYKLKQMETMKKALNVEVVPDCEEQQKFFLVLLVLVVNIQYHPNDLRLLIG